MYIVNEVDYIKLNRNVLDVMVDTCTMTTCIATAILAINKVHPCREIRDTIKEYLFFDIRTIAYANYLSGKRFDMPLFRFDSDIDEDGSLGPGYFAFWNTAPIEDNGCGIRSIAEDNHAYSDERHRSSSEYEDIEPPQFEIFFCTVCGNYATPPHRMEMTLFHRSLRDRLFCVCDDDEV